MLLMISMLSTAFHGVGDVTPILFTYLEGYILCRNRKWASANMICGHMRLSLLWVANGRSEGRLTAHECFIGEHMRSHRLRFDSYPQRSSVHAELVVSMKEEDQIYVRELHVPPTENDPVFESVPNRNRERHPVERRAFSLRRFPSHPPMRSPSPPLMRSPLPPLSHSPRRSPSRAPTHLSRGSPAPSQTRHSDDFFARMTGIIREELGMMRRDFTTEVVALREEIGLLRRDFTIEVVTLRDEIGVLR
ncbi:uncharacterized protein LOC111388796 isoform X4 [Olea europaea var. sylvestris]|uniref:uncharacterized protein LOC111388796 isoform X4 n=1 Tax=Olea europaea var. sylvestris TaxID=158386 RepID=UPI000C1D02AC|nr:uncharacterized protein LOC111388796 isoform X4 [Olea europaea var. sylvestris]